MAIQAQLYWENFGFSLGRGGVSQDHVENGYGLNDQFCFNLQHKQQEQLMQPQNNKQLQLLQQDNQNLCSANSSLLPKNNNHLFSRSILDQMEKQRQEIDQYVRIQNERLRLVLLEQRKQQLATILRKYESRAQVLLGQKDEEIAKAVNRKIELENFLRGMEIESQTWQRVAKENEAIVMSLNNTIEQLRESAVCLSTNGPENAESCCDVMVMEEREDGGEEKTGGNRGFQENEEQRRTKLFCRKCNSGNSCVIFLPCRHLCSCKACEAFLDSCPVCGMVKKSSIEALF